MYLEIKLDGKCSAELDTEVRFNIAAARVDGVELARLVLPFGGDERDNSRVLFCLTKVLRAMMREGSVQFYETDEGFKTSTTEAKFLENKYPDFLVPSDATHKYVYVKI